MISRLLPAVALALLLVGCGSRPAGVPLDHSLAELVPSDTILLAGVRMDALRATPVYRKWVGDNPVVNLDKFAKETGLDPRKDVSELLIASDGKRPLVLARGEFPVERLEEMLVRSGAKKTPYRGRALIGSGDAAVVFLNSRTAAAGPPAALRVALDGGGGVPQGFRDRLKTVAPETQIWLLASGVTPMLGKGIPDFGNLGGNLRKIADSVENVTVAFDLRAGLKMTAGGVCKTEQDAKFIHDAIRGLLGMGRLSTPDNEPELLRFYDSFQVAQRQTAIALNADIPMDVLESTLERMKRLRSK